MKDHIEHSGAWSLALNFTIPRWGQWRAMTTTRTGSSNDNSPDIRKPERKAETEKQKK